MKDEGEKSREGRKGGVGEGKKFEGRKEGR
jgi:hypothetical protein